MRKLLIVACSLFALSSTSAYAHSIWLAKQHGQYVVVYGEGANSDPYVHKNLLNFKGWEGSKSTDLVATKHDTFYSIDVAKSQRVSFELDNGYFTKDPSDKWVAKPKNEVPDAKEGGHYLKYAVAILDSDAQVNKPVGLPLEIVTDKNPLSLKLGDKLELTVLYNGKPLPNVKINTNLTNCHPDDVIKTNAQGQATMIMANGGLNVLEVSYKADLNNDPKADYDGISTTLSFSYPFHH